MATVKQFRFFGYGNEDNYDGGNSEKGVNYSSLVSGDLFFYDNYRKSVYKLVFFWYTIQVKNYYFIKINNR